MYFHPYNYLSFVSMHLNIFQSFFPYQSFYLTFYLSSFNIKFTLELSIYKFYLSSFNIKFTLELSIYKFYLSSFNIKFTLELSIYKYYLSRRCTEDEIKVKGANCLIWKRFSNLFETLQSLYWSAFGLIRELMILLTLDYKCNCEIKFIIYRVSLKKGFNRV
jgi:hypothetical protein